ncbi:ammonium transporter [Archangium minus]|uniref:Ammonium transporter n=1 Tax=Archangium minus TaxID=83450 RepID=A0ABY9X4G3_9BACT|nr:ammonium transporter [Archangium minus]
MDLRVASRHARKNVLATFMYSFFALALVTVQWVVFGYSLAFGKSHGGFIGGGDYLLLENVTTAAKGSIPHLVFMGFQLKFAIITPALISGAFVERMKFSAYALFILLWGSALTAGPLAGLAFVTTHVAAGAAALSWTVAEWYFRKRPTLLGFVSGLVAGLVAITPAAGFVSPAASLVIGGLAGVVCYGAVLLKERLHYDDSLDAWGVHGVGGLLGALLVGVFSQASLNPAGADGLLHGNPALLGKQALAVLAVGAYTAVVTLLLLKVVDKVLGLRVSEEERMGLDSTQHGEAAYTS